jgi:hypothetical protein
MRSEKMDNFIRVFKKQENPMFEGFRRSWVLFVIAGAITIPVLYYSGGFFALIRWVTVGAVSGIVVWGAIYYTIRGFVKKE